MGSQKNTSDRTNLAEQPEDQRLSEALRILARMIAQDLLNGAQLLGISHPRKQMMHR